MTEETNTELTQEQKDAAAAEAYRAQVNGTKEGEIPQRPDDVPEKFWDAEKGEVNVAALVKSYAELEKLKGKAEEAKPEEKKADEVTTEDDPKAAFAALREETTRVLAETGAISDEIYARYDAVGFSREDVDEFVEFKKGQAEALIATEIFGAVGGQEKYAEMIDWARTAYSPDEVRAYDRDLDSKDPAVRKVAVDGLKARYVAANGTEGRSVTNEAKSGGAEVGYRSKAEMVSDMRDPKYAKDPAFRNEVARKVRAAVRNGVTMT